MEGLSLEDKWITRQISSLDETDRKFLAGMAYAAITHDPEIFEAATRWLVASKSPPAPTGGGVMAAHEEARIVARAARLAGWFLSGLNGAIEEAQALDREGFLQIYTDRRVDDIIDASKVLEMVVPPREYHALPRKERKQVKPSDFHREFFNPPRR